MFFNYQNNELFAERMAVAKIAEQYGTPCYIYSRAAIEQQWQAFNKSLSDYPHLICYAVKANSNLAVLNILARLGSGFDIVSGGELARVLAAGGKAEHIVFSGVGKTNPEIEQALNVNIGCFNVESTAELERIEAIAKHLNKRAPIALRINPNIDAGTHPYISTGLKENKFGITSEEVFSCYQNIAKSNYLSIAGIACHIGSQITELAPFLQTIDYLLAFIDRLKKHHIDIKKVDIGGGLGVRYHTEQVPSPAEYTAAILDKIKQKKLELILEPGRAIVANAGILVTKIEYLKHTSEKNFVIVDAGMNDLIRPALYDAWQNIIPVIQHDDITGLAYDIVGPVCETADFLGKNRYLPVKSGDLLAICGSGAYGFVMSSNYNSRPRVAEIMVDNDKSYLIRKRESTADLFTHETILPQ